MFTPLASQGGREGGWGRQESMRQTAWRPSHNWIIDSSSSVFISCAGGENRLVFIGCFKHSLKRVCVCVVQATAIWQGCPQGSRSGSKRQKTRIVNWVTVTSKQRQSRNSDFICTRKGAQQFSGTRTRYSCVHSSVGLSLLIVMVRDFRNPHEVIEKTVSDRH